MLHAFLLTALLLPSGTSTQQASREGSLFVELSGAPAAGLGLTENAVERRAVGIRRGLLGDAGALRTSLERLSLELFGGETVSVRHVRSEVAYGGGFLWMGAIEGAADSDVVLSVTGDAVVGSIRWNGELLRISPAGSGAHWLARIDESRFAGCATTSPSVAGPPRAPVTGPAEAATAGNPDIDVMVVYSPEAKDAAGGESAMTSLINLAVTETNDAYEACGVSQRLRLAYVQEMVGYNEPSSFSTILNHLTSKTDGNLDEVHGLRDTYGADAVVMICENGQYCGIAHLMTNVGPGFEDRAFSVTNYGCATGYYSFGHELGHNFGSHHDPANAGSAAFSYSYGYRTLDQQYRTIMAYAPGTRVKRFSSPSATWLGNVMGTASQDNARSLNNTAATAAAWRHALIPSTLSVSGLVAGSTATFGVNGAQPNGTVVLAYSAAGGGPTSTPFGTAALTPPIRVFATLLTNDAGQAATTVQVPTHVSGLTLWFQALDLGTGLLGEGSMATVQ